MKKICLPLIIVIFLMGCTTVQTINKIKPGIVNNVCIAEHKEVRETVLEVIEEGLTRHGIKYRVIPGSYVLKNNHWVPTFQAEQTSGCDAVLFYVANWTWDITMYMHFANIWMVTPDGKTSLGNARYDARASLNKYINARNKLLELIDNLFGEYQNVSPSVLGQPSQKSSVADSTSPADAVPVVIKPNTTPANPSSNPISQKLKELQDMRNQGLISNDDYQQKKKQLLDQM